MSSGKVHAGLEEPVWNRNAGRYDLGRFDGIYSTSRTAAYKSSGLVDVDCRFQFKDSRLGTLGRAKIDAGIIHMETNLHHPPGYSLKWARIQLTLDEEEASSIPTEDDDINFRHVPIHITNYGPQRISDPQKLNRVEKLVELEPCFECSGTGVSPGKYASINQFEHESQWTLRSWKLQSKERFRRKCDNVLLWDLSNGGFASSQILKTQLFTAFAYEHCGHPFFMKVKIYGWLVKLQDQTQGASYCAKDELKFSPRMGKEEDIATILVSQNEGEGGPLDEQAAALDTELILKNTTALTREPRIVRASPRPQSTLDEEGQPPDFPTTTKTRLADAKLDPLIEELAKVAAGTRALVSRGSRSSLGSSLKDRCHIADNGLSTTAVSTQAEDGVKEAVSGYKLVVSVAQAFAGYVTWFWKFVLYVLGFQKARKVEGKGTSDDRMEDTHATASF